MIMGGLSSSLSSGVIKRNSGKEILFPFQFH